MIAMKPLVRQFARFAVVGGLATALQYVVLVVLVDVFAVAALPASGSGYVVSAAFNYWLNHRYTFHSTRAHAAAVPRFVLVSACGLVINQAVIGAMLGWTAAHYLVAQLAATVCVMAWNFVLGRIWTFGNLDGIRNGH